MENKHTVIIGASTNPERMAYLAAERLLSFGHDITPIGIKKGEIQGVPILDIKEKPSIENVDTVTLYLGSANQTEWIDYILSLNPKRIIFNPGTENQIFFEKAKVLGIESIYACTIVMLASRSY